MRRIKLVLAIATVMAMMLALSAGTAFAVTIPNDEAYCNQLRAESHAPDQADQHIPADPQQFACAAVPRG